MSAVLIAIPFIAWPYLVAGASAVATAMGYSIHTTVKTHLAEIAEHEKKIKEALTHEVEWEVKNAKELAATVDEDKEFTLTKEGITLTFRKTALGKCKVCVTGMMSEEQLKLAGENVLNQIKQQVAKTRVYDELQKRGYDTVSEEQLKDGTLRIKVRKWG